MEYVAAAFLWAISAGFTWGAVSPSTTFEVVWTAVLAPIIFPVLIGVRLAAIMGGK